MTRSPPAGRQLSFQAPLEPWAEGMDYCAVSVPPEITEALGTTGPVLVLARVNDSARFQVSLFPVGGGRHCIRIKAKVRRETRTGVGDLILVRFTVLDRAEVAIPDDLIQALETADLLEAFRTFPPGKQNFTIRRIDEAARPATRARRIDEAVAEAHRHSQGAE